MNAQLHLWEADHPYSCQEGNFFKNGHNRKFDSWADFATTTVGVPFMEGNVLYDFDDELNFLWRWDWIKANPENYILDPEDPADESAQFAEDQKTDRLMLFFMLQRKAFNISAEVIVTEEDESAVRVWLEARARKLRQTWSPLLDVADAGSGVLCDSDGCLALATVWLMFTHQPGHVHNCPGHERINVEHSAVVAMGLVDDGHPCEGPIYSAKPTPKES